MLRVNISAAAMAAFFAIAVPVQAQTAENEDDDSGSPDAAIVVTASKFGSTNLDRTAVSAEVVSGEALSERQITDAQSLASSVAGVSMDLASNTPKIAIRGIGFDAFLSSAENGVASYLDGIVIQRAQAANVPFLDLERVDILKGPQGTSFGRNATGGLINYITNKPRAGFSSEIRAGIGSNSRRFADGFLNLGNDSVALRVSGKFDKDNGFVRNLVTGNKVEARDEIVGRVSIMAKPTANLTLNAFYQHYERDNTQGIANADAASAAAVTALVNRPLPPGVAQLVNPNVAAAGVVNKNYTVINRFDGFIRENADMVGLTAEYDLGSIKITSITGYLDYVPLSKLDVGGPSNSGPGVITGAGNGTSSKQLSQEILVGRQAGRFRWVIGGYYLREKATSTGSSLIAGTLFGQPAVPVVGIFFNDTLTLRSLAGYVDTQYELTPSMRISAGARYTSDRKTAGGFTQAFGAPGVGARPLDGLGTTNSKLTGHIDIDADLSEDHFIYVKYARGYKSGGLNTSNATFYVPETLDSFEAGVKGKLFDRVFRYSLTGFYSKYKNIQAFVIPQGLGATSAVVNASSAEIYGVEGAFDLSIGDVLSFDGNLSWLPEANYGQFLAVDPQLGAVDYVGARLSRSPKFSGLIGANVEISSIAGVGLRARAELLHTSTVVYNQREKFLPGLYNVHSRNLVNMNLAASPAENVEISIYGRNVFNKVYLTNIQDTFGLFRFGQYGRSQEFGGSVTVRF